MAFDTTNPAKPTIVHDPEAYLDYVWGFTLDAGDTLLSATFAPPTGVTVDQTSVSGSNATGWVRVTDATLVGQTIGITCHYVSVMGRSDDRTLYFKIKER